MICQMCERNVKDSNANLEKHNVAVVRSSTISQTLLMGSPCSKRTAVLVESTLLYFCQNFIAKLY